MRRLFLTLLALSLSGCSAATPARRQQWLDMFARSYFPGRSGQVFVVFREGDIVSSRDPLYKFMHGSPWDYDTHIPILFHGAPFVRRGTWREPATQQDVAPTLAALLGTPMPATCTGRVLEQALAGVTARPRIALLLVLDWMRADYLDTYAHVLPTLTRLRDEGAWFPEARINALPTVTAVGHATLGTGTDPRIHGITVNNLFNRSTGRPQSAYDGLDPDELMALTLADAWSLATDGEALIIGQGGAMRAVAGLVGHGACLINGPPVLAASYDVDTSGWETNPSCYRMSAALVPLRGRDVWDPEGDDPPDEFAANEKRFRASRRYLDFEAEALLAVMDHEALGADDVTDLVLVNLKGPDATGHAFGPDSPEMEATLADLDRQLGRILALLDAKAGPGRSVVAVTADHGMPGEPAPGRRHDTDEIVALIDGRFDPSGPGIVQYYDDPGNSQIYVDAARVRALGSSLEDVARWLESLDFVAAAFSEAEVRAAQAGLDRLAQGTPRR